MQEGESVVAALAGVVKPHEARACVCYVGVVCVCKREREREREREFVFRQARAMELRSLGFL